MDGTIAVSRMLSVRLQHLRLETLGTHPFLALLVPARTGKDRDICENGVACNRVGTGLIDPQVPTKLMSQ